MTSGAVRVLICEDSRTYAAALTRLLEHGDELDVVGVSRTAEEALAALPGLRPDLITMDIELPGMPGLEAVEQIMSAQPVPILVISSRVGPHSNIAAAALAAGALDAVAKGDLDLMDPGGAAAGAFRKRLRLLSKARVIRHPRASLRSSGPARPGPRRSATVIGVCASTGGPQALVAVLRLLPASFPVPLLVVQHMAAGFTEGLALWLDGSVPLPVRLAEEGVAARLGVWLAPEGAHLVLRPSGRLCLDRTTVSGPHCPAGDVLLRSLADTVGPEAVSVVLTGMGRDGAEGSQAVRAAGGLTIAQDQSTSVVFGMPKAAADLGVDLVLPLDRIGAELHLLEPLRRAG